MNWLRQNKFLGAFLIAFGLATLAAGFFVWHEHSLAGDAQEQLDATISELNRLRGSQLFPNDENFHNAKAQADTYRSSLGELEKELKLRTLPIVPLQPNEFQAQLRQTVNDVNEHAATAKVKLPENFELGFDQYATSLPNPVAAPLLSRQLKAIKMLLDGLIDAHVDVVTAFKRAPLLEEKNAPAVAATPNPRAAKNTASKSNAAASAAEAQPIEVAFSAAPSAMRKALNQVATFKEQLFIIRVLNVNNQVDKGSKRETAAAPAPQGTPAPTSVHFIVGTEHLDVTARIDIVNFGGGAKETR